MTVRENLITGLFAEGKFYNAFLRILILILLDLVGVYLITDSGV